MGISRLVRGLALSLRNQPFVEAARALGAGTPRIIVYHVLPNAIVPVLIAGMFMIGDFVIFEAVLSYFGMGFRDLLNPDRRFVGQFAGFQPGSGLVHDQSQPF